MADSTVADSTVTTRFTVRAPPRVLVGLTRVLLRGRDPRLPWIYRYTAEDGQHPNIREGAPVNSIYVYIFDSSQDGKNLAEALEKELEIPYCRMSLLSDQAPGELY